MQSVNLNKTKVKIYPNPTIDKLFVTGYQSKFEQIVILNSVGQDITKYVRFSENASIIEIDISNLNSGVYIIRMKEQSNIILKE